MSVIKLTTSNTDKTPAASSGNAPGNVQQGITDLTQYRRSDLSILHCNRLSKQQVSCFFFF